jgi:hypothetical protein
MQKEKSFNSNSPNINITKSKSDEIRNKGNEKYKNCTQNLPLSTLKDRVYETISIYEEAFKTSTTEAEQFKAKKNIALTIQKLIKNYYPILKMN